MRIPYPPIFVGTVVAIALAAGGAGAGQAKAAAPARKPVRPIDVVTPIVIDKGGWTNDPYLT